MHTGSQPGRQKRQQIYGYRSCDANIFKREEGINAQAHDTIYDAGF
jgi:hypothetical protein